MRSDSDLLLELAEYLDEHPTIDDDGMDIDRLIILLKWFASSVDVLNVPVQEES